MSNFLASLGAALIEGGRAAGRARLERRQEELDRQNREAQLLQMALTRQNMEQGQKAFELQQEDRLYGRAKDALDLAGPEGTLNPDQASLVEQAGLGFRLGPQQEGTLSSTQFSPSMFGTGFEQTPSPGLQAGRSIIPTTEQRGAIEDRRARAAENQARERARAAVTDPRFWKMPVEQRAAVWGQTGYGGNLPQSYDELVRMGQQEHDWRMEEINAMNSWRDQGGGGGGGGARAQQQLLASEYGDERALRIEDAINKLEPRANLMNVGLASLAAYIPGTPQRDFAEDLNFLVSNIGFKELQEMRSASATGGALGQVSDMENRLLQSALGALSQAQSPENFRKNLAQVRASLRRWEEAKRAHGAASGGANVGAIGGAGNSTILLMDPNTGDTMEVPVAEAGEYLREGAVVAQRKP